MSASNAAFKILFSVSTGIINNAIALQASPIFNSSILEKSVLFKSIWFTYGAFTHAHKNNDKNKQNIYFILHPFCKNI